MLRNELGGSEVISKILGKGRAVNADTEVLANLKMKVGDIHAVIVTNRSHLLAPGNALALANLDFIEMGIKRIDRLQFPVFDIGMTDDNDIPPAHSGIHRKCDITIADAINGGAEITIAAFVAIPILARMIFQEATGHIISFPIGLSDRAIKTIGNAHGGIFRPRPGYQPNHKKQQANPEKPTSHVSIKTTHCTPLAQATDDFKYFLRGKNRSPEIELFVAQGGYRIQTGGLQGRVNPGNKPCHQSKPQTEKNRLHG